MASWRYRSCALLLELECRLPAQDTQRVACNHELFVSGNDVAGDERARSRDSPHTLGVRLWVKFKPQPGEPLRYGLANGRGVLADASGEHEAVDTPHCGRKHPGEQGNAVDEVVQCELGGWIRTREQIPHVVAD